MVFVRGAHGKIPDHAIGTPRALAIGGAPKETGPHCAMDREKSAASKQAGIPKAVIAAPQGIGFGAAHDLCKGLDYPKWPAAAEFR